jgi:imidazolonepropionase-like amidohydrolase
MAPGMTAHSEVGARAVHLRGVLLPDDDVADLWVAGDRISRERISGAETIMRGGWLLPGLVDVHTHPGADSPGDPLDDDVLRRDAEAHRDSGVTLIRAPGAAARLPEWFGDDPDLPRVRSAGTWLATENGFFPGWGRRESLETLPDAAVDEARNSGGWCKVIADWSFDDEPVLRYGPTVPPEVLNEIVRRVHAIGGRVAVHSQHEDGCTAAVFAGVDSLEHGMHLRLDLLDRMADQGTVLVPTMCAFSGTKASLRQQPPASDAWGRWKSTGWERHPNLVRCAFEAGVTVLAGTDGAAGIIADEVDCLVAAGVPADVAVGGASWVARSWLGFGGLEHGAPADIVGFDEDPRVHPHVLRRPSRIVLRGRVVR